MEGLEPHSRGAIVHRRIRPRAAGHGGARKERRRSPAARTQGKRRRAPHARLEARYARHDRPWTAHAHSARPWAGGLRLRAVPATRKPALSFRFPAVFLLRFAERRFCGLLFHEPPRNTRRSGAGQAPGPARRCRMARKTVCGGAERPAAKQGAARESVQRRNQPLHELVHRLQGRAGAPCIAVRHVRHRVPGESAAACGRERASNEPSCRTRRCPGRETAPRAPHPVHRMTMRDFR